MFFSCTWYTPTQCLNGHSRCSVTLFRESKKTCWRSRCSSEVFLENCHVWFSLQNRLSVYSNFENIWWLFAGLWPSVCWAAVWLNDIDSLNFNGLQVEVKFWYKQRGVAHIWRQKLCVKLNGGKITRARCKTLETCLLSIIACFAFASSHLKTDLAGFIYLYLYIYIFYISCAALSIK